MANSDAERAANEDEKRPRVGTDPARTPHEEGPQKKQVSPDKEKVEEHEREEARHDESPEEEAAHIKDA